MKFGLPPWLRRAEPESRALVEHLPHPDLRAGGLTAEDKVNGWTEETLAEYRGESDARAMAIVKASMEGRLRPRQRWANSKYSPLHWWDKSRRTI